jgi:metallophosphoesterase (TIGR00282 family)
MKILFIGDTVARAGREFVRDHLGALKAEYQVDFTVLNCENAAAGFGVTPKIADEMLTWGIDVLTSGNHVWDKREILGYLDTQERILRPANYPPGNPGHGTVVLETRTGERVAIVNVQGRTFMPAIDDPFRSVDAELGALSADIRVIVVDFHAEATAEKVAMGWYLDGRASAVLGTHTHIPTADERILPQGLAYQTDVGMTGPFDSVIGMTKESVMDRFHKQIPVRFKVASKDVELNAAVIDVDPETGKARSIERVHRQ